MTLLLSRINLSHSPLEWLKEQRVLANNATSIQIIKMTINLALHTFTGFGVTFIFDLVNSFYLPLLTFN